MKVLRWTHPDFDTPLILFPGMSALGHLTPEQDPNQLKCEQIEMSKDEFDCLPEWEG